jgi:hypothetical protein
MNITTITKGDDSVSGSVSSVSIDGWQFDLVVDLEYECARVSLPVAVSEDCD